MTESRATTSRLLLDRREVGGQRQAHGLHGVHARADQQEGEPAASWPTIGGREGVAREQDQREGHDRQPAEMQSEPSQT